MNLEVKLTQIEQQWFSDCKGGGRRL